MEGNIVGIGEFMLPLRLVKILFMQQVLIDTNIFLNFYRMREESLASLENLLKLIEEEKIELCLPQQVIDEFYRNKWIVSEDYTKQLKCLDGIQARTPSFLKAYKKANDYQKNLKKLQKMQKEILQEYRNRLSNPKSKLNSRINKIFTSARILEEDPALIQRGYYRTLRKNPPRKGNDSFGDAIIWETILDKLTSENLNLISGDGDFSSDIESGNLDEFLAYEWTKKTKKEIKLFTTLGEFINSFTKKDTIRKEIVKQEKIINVTSVSNPNSYKSNGLQIQAGNLNGAGIFPSKVCTGCGRLFSDGLQLGLYSDRCLDCQNTVTISGSVNYKPYTTINYDPYGGAVMVFDKCSVCGEILTGEFGESRDLTGGKCKNCNLTMG